MKEVSQQVGGEAGPTGATNAAAPGKPRPGSRKPAVAPTGSPAGVGSGKRLVDPYLLRQVPLRGELTRRNAAACINRLLILAAEDSAAPIVVEVRSPGGLPAESLALIKTMNGIGCPIATFCREAVGSSAVVVAHGRRGCRAATPDAHLDFAPPSAAAGKPRPQDLSSLQPLAEILAQDTGRSPAETLRWLQQGVQFNAQEALRMGIIDAISPKPVLPELPVA